MEVGSRVRMVNDPARIGVATGRATARAGREYAQVAFPDQTTMVPLDQLELVPDLGESPIELLRRGRFARPSDLYRTLTHIRLAGRLANFIYSLETTDTDFYAYQFKPVLKLLQSSSTGILVADEVGLGKTIEAGLVWTELRSRFDLQRLLVVCPAMLRNKWARELGRRFGVKAVICDAEELVSTLEQVKSREVNDCALVVSFQGTRPPADWDSPEVGGPRAALARLLSDSAQEAPLIDLLVIDEAHYMRNPDTRTFELGMLLRGTSQFAMLLSATPVHLRSDDLFNLLRIVDEDVFNERDVFEFIRQANTRLIALRDVVLAGRLDALLLRAEISSALKHPLLMGNRQLEQLMGAIDTLGDLRDPKVRVDVASRLEAANLLGFAVSRTRRREVKEWRAVRDAKTLDVQMNVLERRFYDSVTAIVKDYCTQADQAEGFLLVMPQRQAASCMAAAMWAWSQDDTTVAEELFDELGIELPEAEATSPGPVVSEIRARVRDFASLTELTAHDTKYARLRDELRSLLAGSPREKVVLFSSFRATLRYLQRRLHQDGISSALLLGGDPDQQATLERFAQPDGPSVLLSSEVGSEGIDLQFAWVLVNYDLPWNPMKVEQRIGRLDRLGQQSPQVVIWNLVHVDTIDERIYNRLLVRLGIFKHTLGDLEVVLGERMVSLTRDLMRRDLTPAQEEARIDQTAVALENVRRNEEVLEQEASSLVAYGDYIIQQVEAARSLSRRIKAADTQRYVADYLAAQYPGCRIVQDASDPSVMSIQLSPAAKSDLQLSIRERRTSVATLLTRNDPGAVRCRFSDRVKVATGAGEEIVNQFHPLVRFVADQAEERHSVGFPAVSARIPSTAFADAVPAGDYWMAVSRWTFEALRVSEQLWFSVTPADGGMPLSDEASERFVTTVADAGQDWNIDEADVLLAVAADAIEQTLLVRAQTAYEAYAAGVKAQNEDRADAQVRSLSAHLESQRTKYETLRDRHLARGNTGLARVQDGTIERLAARIERERVAVNAKRQVRSRLDDIAVGIVRVF